MLNLSRTPTNTGYYKSFKVLSYANHAPTGLPSTLEIRRYKKYVEFRVHTGWFSESRGTGHTSHRKVKVTDVDVLARVDALIDRPREVTGLFPMIDTLAERLPDLALLPLLQRWFALAQSANPSALVDDERRERALADKRFAVGDLVVRTGEYPGRVYRIISEHFDSRPYLSHEWWFRVPGDCSCPQSRLRKATDDDLVAMVCRLESVVE